MVALALLAVIIAAFYTTWLSIMKRLQGRPGRGGGGAARAHHHAHPA